jgi:hypothetical protein
MQCKPGYEWNGGKCMVKCGDNQVHHDGKCKVCDAKSLAGQDRYSASFPVVEDKLYRQKRWRLSPGRQNHVEWCIISLQSQKILTIDRKGAESICSTFSHACGATLPSSCACLLPDSNSTRTVGFCLCYGEACFSSYIALTKLLPAVLLANW